MNDHVAQTAEPKKIHMPLGPKDHADGIYFRMSDADYHGDTALGASGICDLLISPLAFYKKSAMARNRLVEEQDEKETAATIRGTYFHNALANIRGDVVVKPAGMSFATKEGKAFKADHEGATFIKAEHATMCQDMIDAMRETGVLERIGGIGGGVHEVAFFWTDKIGRRRKMKIDRLFGGEAFDWKTMANPMSKDLETLVSHVVAQHRYHIKALHYQIGLQAMKKMISTKGAAAFMTETAEADLQAMLALSQSDDVVPFWYVFIENSGIPNIVARKFVSHDASSQLNAYFRGADQGYRRALGTFDAYMTSHGPDKPWFSEVTFNEFTDDDFASARWILAED